MSIRRRWLFGDQLGPSFLDAPDQPVLLIESRRVFGRRAFHRQKAHLILSAMRHRAAELGEQCRYFRVGSYAEALAQVQEPLDALQPTSWGAVHYLDKLAEERDGTAYDVERLPARGYATSRGQFAEWADGRGRRRLLMEDFYRDARTRLDVLMEGREPVTGRWNYDAENREPAPKGRTGLGVPEPSWPVEDDIDAQVRDDLDRWAAEGLEMVGQDGPRRFAATRAEALAALETFVAERLPTFGPYEDAVVSSDRWMAHSLLSAPLNLGLLDPLELVRAAEDAYAEGHAPIASVEGFIRQVI
ncbi:MAG: cryptochrome/photolyase family protein, partial [Actinomycetes bacterium]